MRLIDADELLLHISDYQLQESPDWGANGYGNADAYEAITNCIKAIEEAPTLHPEPELKGEILEAVEMLKEKYEEAKKISYINKPFEYALYHTWKEFDGRNKMTR